jgi:hypothetical protein
MTDEQFKEVISGFNQIIKGLITIGNTLGFIAFVVLIMMLKTCSM